MELFMGNGRLAKAPVINATQAGNKVANLTLVVNTGYTDAQGVSETFSLNCSVFRDSLVEFVEKNLEVGDKILVQGELRPDNYQDKTTNKMIYGLRCNLRSIEFDETKEEKNARKARKAAQQNAAPAVPQQQMPQYQQPAAPVVPQQQMAQPMMPQQQAPAPQQQMPQYQQPQYQQPVMPATPVAPVAPVAPVVPQQQMPQQQMPQAPVAPAAPAAPGGLIIPGDFMMGGNALSIPGFTSDDEQLPFN